MKYAFASLVVLGLIATWTIHTHSSTKTEVDFKSDVLPSGAKNFKDVGNGWMTFEVDFDGRVNRFMIGKYRRSDVVPTLVHIN